MFVYTCNYVDFLGNEREEIFRFNLSQTELVNYELTTEGGVKQLIEKMIQAQDTPSLTKFTQEFIKASYGEISPDGRRFDKSEELWNKFYRTNAYDELFMKMVTDSQFAIDFIDGVMPAEDPHKNANKQNLIAIEKAKQMAQERRAARTSQ